MSQYLSTIATRSSANHAHDLLPSLPEFNASESAMEEESVNPDRSESIEPGTFVRPSYFSRSIERVEPDDQVTSLKDNSHEAVRYEIVKPFQHVANEKADPDDESKPVFSDKTIQKIILQPKVHEKLKAEDIGEKLTADSTNETISVIKPMIKTLGKEEAENGNQFQLNDSRIEHISPVSRDIDQGGKIHYKNTIQSVPKLVIGKITVEILPPVKGPTEKIIQRIVQTPTKDNFSKTNKLMFGLGQL